MKIIGKQEKSLDKLYIEAVSKYTGQKVDNLLVCQKLSIDGIIFSSHLIVTKRSDSCFYTKTNKIGLIELSNRFVRL